MTSMKLHPYLTDRCFRCNNPTPGMGLHNSSPGKGGLDFTFDNTSNISSFFPSFLRSEIASSVLITAIFSVTARAMYWFIDTPSRFDISRNPLCKDSGILTVRLLIFRICFSAFFPSFCWQPSVWFQPQIAASLLWALFRMGPFLQVEQSLMAANLF